MIIQLPMYNEEAHADLIIYECCKIVWPSNRVLIQVRRQPAGPGHPQAPSASSSAPQQHLG